MMQFQLNLEKRVLNGLTAVAFVRIAEYPVYITVNIIIIVLLYMMIGQAMKL